MSIIDVIRARFEKYPGIRYDYTEGSVVVHPGYPEGFIVRVVLDGSGFTVSYGEWEEYFGGEAEAADCFFAGLSSSRRLRVCSRGQTEYLWIVEALRNGDWCEDSSSRMLFHPFWKERTERFFQNRLIEDG